MQKNPLRVIADTGGLPSQATTRSGVVFNPQVDRWRFRDGVTEVDLDWSNLHSFSADHLHSIKSTMLWYAKHGAPSSLRPLFIALRQWLTLNPKPALTLKEYQLFRAHFEGTLILGAMRSFLRKWDRLRLPGLSRELMTFVWETKERDVPHAVAVATMDPRMGPFTDTELESIQCALTQAYSENEIRQREYVLAWFFIIFGARPIQLAAMKVKDVHRRTVEGQHFYDVDIPRAKQRTVIRTHLKNRPLISQIGSVAHDYSQRVRHRFDGLLDDPSEAPLFPQFEKRVGEWSLGFKYHQSKETIGQLLRRALDRLEVRSERTGTNVHISAIRFRRTLGTRAAQEGHGAFVIADLLDHSDNQNVGVYVESRPEMAQRIDKALAYELAPLAEAFKGRLVRSPSEATREGDPAARIKDLRFGAKEEGYCGRQGMCGFSAPIACYTCLSFEPWLDGPHEAVLESLLEKRERQMKNGDYRIASINDRTILAVARVVQLCRDHVARNE